MNRDTKCRCFFLIPLMFVALSSTAQTDRRPQREMDGLVGPVRSVSVRTEKSPIKFEQPDSRVVVLSVLCLECEYDKDGHRTKRGQTLNAQFQGLLTRYVHDANGMVVEVIEENPKGEPTHRALMGPFGPVEEQLLVVGVWRTLSVSRYDQRGNQVERTAFDLDGTVTERMNATYDELGMATEEWHSGGNYEFRRHIVHTYDRKTKFETYTNVLEDGSAGLIFVLQDAKVLSYWQPPGSKQGSLPFFWDTGPRNRESRTYHADGTYERVESTFLDDQKRNVARVEFYDSASVLKAAADYQYEFDVLGNWLKRTVRVWTPELGSSELYETNYRVLTYW